MDEKEVVEYLRTKVKDESIEDTLDMPLMIFANLSARQFAIQTSWEEVMGQFKRVWG